MGIIKNIVDSLFFAGTVLPSPCHAHHFFRPQSPGHFIHTRGRAHNGYLHVLAGDKLQALVKNHVFD